MVILRATLIAALLATACTGLADPGFSYYPNSGFSIQIYSGPGYYRHHHHHHYHPRPWHGYHHGHWRPFGFYAPPRYRYGYYPPGLNINWRRYRCD